MRYKLICASCLAAVAVVGAAPAYGAPAGPSECGNSNPNEGPVATSSPGNAATSPGSVFNEPGVNSVNGGKGNQAYNNAGASAQYDRACARVTAADSGTPIVPTPGAMNTNNSRDTRTTLGVTHTGKGNNK